MPKPDELEETITIPKKEYDLLLSLVKQSNILLSAALAAIKTIHTGILETKIDTRNDKSNDEEPKSNKG